MQFHVAHRQVLFGLWVLFSFVSSYHGEAFGTRECAGCLESRRIKSDQDSSAGFGITIACRSANGEFKTGGMGRLYEGGKFRASFLHKTVKTRALRGKCYAELHTVSGIQCHSQIGIKDLKTIFGSTRNGKFIFNLSRKLVRLPAICNSAFLWPYHKNRQLLEVTPAVQTYRKSFPPPPPVYRPETPMSKHAPPSPKPEVPPPPVSTYEKPPPNPAPAPVPTSENPPAPLTPSPPYGGSPPPSSPPAPAYERSPPPPAPPVPAYKRTPPPPNSVCRPAEPTYMIPLPPIPKLPPILKTLCPPIPSQVPPPKLIPHIFEIEIAP